MSKKEKCARHPYAAHRLDTGDCWECQGRPAWQCTACGKPFPCYHYQGEGPPAVSDKEAECRARAEKAVDAFAQGMGTWQIVCRALDEYARAVRDAYDAKRVKGGAN